MGCATAAGDAGKERAKERRRRLARGGGAAQRPLQLRRTRARRAPTSRLQLSTVSARLTPPSLEGSTEVSCAGNSTGKGPVKSRYIACRLENGLSWGAGRHPLGQVQEG